MPIPSGKFADELLLMQPLYNITDSARAFISRNVRDSNDSQWSAGHEPFDSFVDGWSSETT